MAGTFADLDVSSTSPTSSPSSSGDEESADVAKIREAIAPEFENICHRVAHAAPTENDCNVTDMELCRNGVDSSFHEKPPSVRERWSLSREAAEVNPLKVSRGSQDHVAVRLGTIIERFVCFVREVVKSFIVCH
jgi:hypothetical protein